MKERMLRIVLFSLTFVGIDWMRDTSAVEAVMEDPPLAVDTILQNPLTADDYRTSERCISNQRFRSVEIVDEHYILFIGRNEVWVNRLRHRCIGLQANMVPVLDMTSGRVCQMDRLRGVSSGVSTQFCSLGEFEKIQEFRADRLKEAITAHGRSKVGLPQPPVENK